MNKPTQNLINDRSATSCLNLTKLPAKRTGLFPLRKEVPVCHTGPYRPTSTTVLQDARDRKRNLKLSLNHNSSDAYSVSLQ